METLLKKLNEVEKKAEKASCFLFIFNLFIYLCLAVLGLRCCLWAFSSCGKRGATFHCSAWASHCGGFLLRSMGSRSTGFSSCGMWAQ